MSRDTNQTSQRHGNLKTSKAEGGMNSRKQTSQVRSAKIMTLIASFSQNGLLILLFDQHHIFWRFYKLTLRLSN